MPLRLEPGNDLPRVHPQFNDFDRHPPLDRFALLGDIDDSKASLPNLFEDVVAADHGARTFFWRKNQRFDLIRHRLGLKK